MADRPRTVLGGVYFDDLLDAWKQRAARIAAFEAENATLRAHVVALVGALDACRRTIGGRDEDHPVMEQADYVLRAPDLAALVGRERKRDVVIEAARLSAPYGAPTWDVQKGLRQALAALDAPDGEKR